MVFRCLDPCIHCGKVEVKLAYVFGFEGTGLELDYNVVFQTGMVEKQVHKELTAFHFKPYLASHKGKTSTYLQ